MLPLPIYNYRVNIGSTSVAFTEVSGLTISVEKHTFKESATEKGQVGPKVYNFPGQATPPTITMKKGLIPTLSQPAFYDWINGITLNQVQKRDIVISLCNETGDPVVVWTVVNAFPTKLTAPTFDVNSNDVAIETLELSADKITINYAP